MKKSRYAVLLAASIAVAIAVLPFRIVAYANLPSIPSSVEVAVGYADTEREVGTYRGTDFPSPWCGSPGVQFIGSSTNYNGNSTDPSNCEGGDWDGGAILVTNAGESPIALTNLTVTLPLPASGNRGSPSCPLPARPVTFNLWFGRQYYYGNPEDPAYDGGPITVPPGGQVIFDGTSSDHAETCPSGSHPSGPTNGTYDFDTSDLNFLSGCTPTNDTASDPRITFSVTGYAPTTYLDLGHTLDTGGIDVGMCKPTVANPEWPNESLGWRSVSSTCGEGCTANQIGLAATTTSAGQTALVGGSVTSTGLATTFATSSVSVVRANTAYGIAVVAVILMITIGYLATRRSRSLRPSPP